LKRDVAVAVKIVEKFHEQPMFEQPDPASLEFMMRELEIAGSMRKVRCLLVVG
jgi:hypothetical protein